MNRIGISIWLGTALVAALLALPSLALGDATISRHGNRMKLVSDGDGDKIKATGTDVLHSIAYYVEPGHVLRAGHGCHRVREAGVAKVIVDCGAPSLHENDGNHVTLEVKLGGGDDTFVADPYSDVQPRIVADGGPGNDRIEGSVNADEIEGGPGEDEIWGEEGDDTLRGGDGFDRISGDAGDDAIDGGSGSDSVKGDEIGDFPYWGNDVIVSAGDVLPDLSGFYEDLLDCGPGPEDVAVVDEIDNVFEGCENLSGGQNTPPRDTVGSSPLRVAIEGSAAIQGGFHRAVEGVPIHIPISFSEAATISSTLRVSAADARRLGLRNPVIARGIGTPLVLTPTMMNAQISLLWSVRQALTGLDSLQAKLSVTGTAPDGSSDTAVKAVVLH